MKPETKEKVMQFVAAHEGKAFKNEDWEKQKSSFVFFHVMKKIGTVLSAKGFSKAKIRKGAAAEYLRTVAIQTGKGARTWRKKTVQTQLSIHDVAVPVVTMTEQGCIAYLKSLGCYKIMKLKTQWEEI